MNEKILAQELGKVLKDVLVNSSRVASGGSAHANNTNQEKERRRNTKTPDRLDINLLDTEFKKLARTFKAVNSSIEKYRDNQNENTHTLGELLGAQTKLMDSMIEHEKLSNKSLEKLRIKMKEDLANHSFMGKSMKDYADRIQDIGEVFDETAEFMAGYNDVLEEHQESLLGNISSVDKLTLALKLMSNKVKLSAEVQQKVRAAIRSGSEDQLRAVASSIDAENTRAREMRNALSETIIRHEKYNTIIGNTTAIMENFGNSVGLGFIKQAATVVGAFGLLGFGIKGLYDQFNKLAQVGYGTAGAFTTVIQDSMRFGIEHDALVKTLAENRNTVSKMGLDKFGEVLGDNMRSLRKLGIEPEDAAEALGQFTEAAKLAGVNINDRSALNDAISKQTKSFEKLRVTTGMTIDQYNAYNRQLLDNSDIRKDLVRMNKAERTQAVFNMIAMRDAYTQMGLTADQAQDLVMKLKETGNMTVKDRFEQSAKLTQAMAALGMGSEAGEIRQLMLKGNARTSTDNERMASLLMQFGKAREQAYGSGNLALQNMLDNVGYNFGGAIDGIIDKGIDLEVQDQRKLSGPEVEAAKAQGRVPNLMVDVKNAIDIATAAIVSPLGMLVAGMGGVLFLLSKRRMMGLGNGGGPANPTSRIGKIGKGIRAGVGAAGKGIGGLGSAVLGGAKMAGLFGLGISAVAGGILGVMNASEIFGSSITTMGQKVSAGLGGAISGLTLGLIDTETAAKAIHSFGTGVSNFAADMWSGITNSDFGQTVQKAYKESGVIGVIGAGLSSIQGFYLDSIKTATDFIFGEGSTDKIKEITTKIFDKASALGTQLINSISAGWNAATGWLAEKTGISLLSNSSTVTSSNKSSVSGIEKSKILRVASNAETGVTKDLIKNETQNVSDNKDKESKVSIVTNSSTESDIPVMEQILQVLTELLEVNKDQTGAVKNTERRLRLNSGQMPDPATVISTSRP